MIIDAGAAKALGEGKSLLPAGFPVEGRFERGDAVLVRTSGPEIARGLAAYGHDEANAIIAGKRSEIEAILGYVGRAEMIHRDNMVIQRKSQI